MELQAIIKALGFRFARYGAMFCDHAVHIEQALVVSTVDELRNELLARGTKLFVCSAKPLKIRIAGGDEGLCPCCREIIREGSAFVIFAFCQRMTFRYREILEPVLTEMTTQRVKPADQRPVAMHFTPLRAEKDAGAILLLPQLRTKAVDGPSCTELRCAFAPRAGEARNFVRVKLNVLVLATAGAASADIAERCAGPRNGVLARHQSRLYTRWRPSAPTSSGSSEFHQPGPVFPCLSQSGPRKTLPST